MRSRPCSRRTRRSTGRRVGGTRPRCTCSTSAARAPLPDRGVRPPHPRRSRRGALVPRRTAGDHDRGLGAPPDAAGFACQWRTEVQRRPCARGAGRPRAVPRGPLRGSRRATPESVRTTICAIRRASPTSRRCSSTPAVDVRAKAAPAAPQPATDDGRARLADSQLAPKTSAVRGASRATARRARLRRRRRRRRADPGPCRVPLRRFRVERVPGAGGNRDAALTAVAPAAPVAGLADCARSGRPCPRTPSASRSARGSSAGRSLSPASTCPARSSTRPCRRRLARRRSPSRESRRTRDRR